MGFFAYVTAVSFLIDFPFWGSPQVSALDRCCLAKSHISVSSAAASLPKESGLGPFKVKWSTPVK